MATETDLCNDALGQIGAAHITNIADGSINANHCAIFLPTLRDSLLRSHHWNFAMARVELALDVTAPVFEFTYAYTLPPDCLKLVTYYGATTATITNWSTQDARVVQRYRIEGRRLLSHDSVALILYLRRLTDPTQWDAAFYQVVAAALASKLAAAILKDARMSISLLQQAYDVLLPMALAVDGQEQSIEPFVQDDLTWGRGRG